MVVVVVVVRGGGGGGCGDEREWVWISTEVFERNRIS